MASAARGAKGFPRERVIRDEENEGFGVPARDLLVGGGGRRVKGLDKQNPEYLGSAQLNKLLFSHGTGRG